MRILLNTVDTNRTGGVANYYRVLRKYLGSDVDYLFVGRRESEANYIGPFIRLMIDYISFLIKMIKCDYDLIHINPSLIYKSLIRDAIFVIFAKLFHKRVVVFFRGWNIDCQRFLDRRGKYLFGLVYFHADAIIVLASEFKNVIEKWGYCGPIYIETTAVDDEIFADKNNVFSPDFNIICKQDDLFNILFLTRIEKCKGIYEAINTFKILYDKFPNVRLIIAGDGNELVNSTEYANKVNPGKIHFVGYLREHEKTRILLMAHCYLFPSSHGEGMPNSILEAMACGLPIVTRPVGGIKDFFEDEKMGFFVESKNPHDFANKIELLILEPELRKRIGVYNRHYSNQRFAASSVADRLKSIYNEVYNNKI